MVFATEKITLFSTMKNLNQDVKIPSITNFYRNDKTEYWPTSINESFNWLPFFDIMEFTADRIENDKNYYRQC